MMNGETSLVEARLRLLQMHFESGVGHLGGNLSSLDAMYVVFRKWMRPADAFILSKGHSAGALYVALWASGRLEESALQSFHADQTLLAGHPPLKGLEDVLFATGSLGHGLSLAAGTALGKKLKKLPQQVACLTSDGEWQEGSTWEALIFAAHHKLNNLKVLVDVNGFQAFGTTTGVSSMEDLGKRLAGFDVAVTEVNGHDETKILAALEAEKSSPHIILLRTVKGHGVSFLENRLESHYWPLTADQFQQASTEISRLS